jgi:hypothetical protein
MSTNMLEQVKNISKTNPHWKILYRKLRLNGEIVDPDNFKITSSYNYQNMNLIERLDKEILWTAITIVGREGQIELHHRAKFDANGDFVDGRMNSFSFGMMDMDEEVIEEYFHELQGKFSTVDYWDVISDETDDSILKQFDIPI